MMERIINTMFHGSTKAKIFLWSIVVMILATILLAVFAVAMGSTTFGVGAAVAGIATFITSQSMSLQELNRKTKKPAKKANQKGGKKTDTKLGKGSSRKSASEEKDAGIGEADSLYESAKGEQAGAADPDSVQDEKEHGRSAAPRNPKEKEREKARYIAGMDAKKMKQLMKHHKVFQKHIFAMIDSYPEEQVVQTPAVLWQNSTHLHILAIEPKAREFQVHMEDIQGIYFEKDVEAHPDTDYASFQYANYMSKLYKPYLPEYREITKDGELIYVKNLFSIKPGISFTNTSAKGLLDILPHRPLLVDDVISRSKYVDEYFKEVYRYSILCKNGVYTLDEYKEKAEGVLQELLEAPVTGKEFSKSLHDMNRYHLITSEHMAKYTQLFIAKTKE